MKLSDYYCCKSG